MNPIGESNNYGIVCNIDGAEEGDVAIVLNPEGDRGMKKIYPSRILHGLGFLH